MPRTWLLAAAAAALLVLVFVVDPLGLFDAAPDDGQRPDGLPEDFLDGPELAGRGTGGADVELTEYEGDPVGTFDFRLGSGVLTGTVTGAGQPLELARVRPVLPPPFTNLAVRTRKDGTYELRGLPLAQHELRASKDGWVARTVVAPLLIELELSESISSGPEKLPAEANVETIDLLRRADAKNAIVVITTDVYGRPVPNAKVLATTAPWDLHLNMGPALVGLSNVLHQSGTTGNDGRCRLSGLEPERYNVVATASGYQTTAIDRVVVTADRERTVRLLLSPGNTISGIVRDIDGTAVADAVVIGLHMGSFASSLATRTDTDGRFALDDLRKGSYMVIGFHEEAGDAQTQAVSPSAGATLKLGGTGKLEIHAVYEDGKPVTRAKVRPYQTKSYNFGQIYSALMDLDDPDGKLEARLPGGAYKVRVKTPAGYTSQDVSVDVVVGETATVEVTVPKTGVVKGVVVDESGNHVAGAEVYVKIGGFPPFKSRERYARTDDEGAFEVVGLALQPIGLHVSHAAHADTKFDATPQPPEQASEVTITMPSGAVVVGHVRDPDGQPIAGEQITLFQGMDWSAAEITFTGGDGAFRFDAVPPGAWQLRQGAFENNAPGVTKTATVGAGGTVTVDFDLAAGAGSVTGVVRVGGKPIAGATVVVTDSRGFSSNVSATTDEAGRFVADGVQPGSIRIYVQTESGISTADRHSFPDGSTSLEVAIDLGTSALTGRVVDTSGEPVANAWMTIESPDEPEGDWSRVKAQKNTDAEGRFAASGLAPGRYQARINSGEHAQRLTDVVTIGDGATVDLGDIVLDPAVLLSGRVTDDAGAPVENVTIALTDAADRPVFLFSLSTTGSDGRYAVQGLKEGRYTVKFEARGYSPFEARIDLGPQGATKDGILARGGTVQVTAKDEGGYPVGGAQVQLIDGQGRVVRWTLSLVNLFEGTQSYTNAEGTVEIADLAAGTYRVRVEADGWVQDDQAVVVVGPGQTILCEVPLHKP